MQRLPMSEQQDIVQRGKGFEVILRMHATSYTTNNANHKPARPCLSVNLFFCCYYLHFSYLVNADCITDHSSHMTQVAL